MGGGSKGLGSREMFRCCFLLCPSSVVGKRERYHKAWVRENDYVRVYAVLQNEFFFHAAKVCA